MCVCCRVRNFEPTLLPPAGFPVSSCFLPCPSLSRYLVASLGLAGTSIHRSSAVCSCRRTSDRSYTTSSLSLRCPPARCLSPSPPPPTAHILVRSLKLLCEPSVSMAASVLVPSALLCGTLLSPPSRSISRQRTERRPRSYPTPLHMRTHLFRAWTTV